MTEQQQPQQHVPPQPTPISITVDQAVSQTGQKFLILSLFTFVGQHIYFLDPETAEQLGARLQQLASQSKSGLILPPSVGSLNFGNGKVPPPADQS